jgi:hypothetical protein
MPCCRMDYLIFFTTMSTKVITKNTRIIGNFINS